MFSYRNLRRRNNLSFTEVWLFVTEKTENIYYSFGLFYTGNLNLLSPSHLEMYHIGIFVSPKVSNHNMMNTKNFR